VQKAREPRRVFHLQWRMRTAPGVPLLEGKHRSRGGAEWGRLWLCSRLLGLPAGAAGPRFPGGKHLRAPAAGGGGAAPPEQLPWLGVHVQTTPATPPPQKKKKKKNH